MSSDSEEEAEEQDFQNESYDKSPDIQYIRNGAKNLHSTIPENYNPF